MAFCPPAGPHLFHEVGDTAYHFANPSMQDPALAAYYNSNAPPMACDIKPRLTKEQHDILEAHYQKQNKPNTNTKKGFAESLNVSLDKVNNWFQNRRAKAKQDAKKQAGAYNLFAQQGSSLNFSSDSDSSPSFTSSEYFAMMQQCATDEQTTDGTGTAVMPHYHEQSQASSYSGNSTPDEQFSGGMQQHLSGNMFDSPQEMNRRTLTQEQFDAFAQNGGIMQSADPQFDDLQHGYAGDTDGFNPVFPAMHQPDFKRDMFAFPAPVGASLPINDSSVSSTISEHSMFPSSATSQEHGSMSSTPPDWVDSRSSSASIASNQDSAYPHVAVPPAPPPPQVPVSTSRWQPGQSVPIDMNELQQQFREATQRTAVQHEQPLAWPADEAFVRRESHGSTMLAQQMSSFALQTPQPQQTATFQAPVPPEDSLSSIAARRQRPRPAALGLASLRSQSFTGSPQPGSPGQQSQNLAPGQQLRRIRSSNVLNGVVQGRVMKSMPGSAQRSPLAWTFADSMNSPKAARHSSSGSVAQFAPPTPMSPNEQARSQFPPWQSSASGHFNRQASISETDAEHNISGVPCSTSSSENVASPPHTPLYHHHHQQQLPQHFAPARIGSTVITENTPPQSAPAIQQSFSAEALMLPQQHVAVPHHTQHNMHGLVLPQQYMSVSVPDQQFQVPATTYGLNQHFAVTAPEPQVSMQFASGVPMVNAQGNLTLAFPPQMQQMQFVQHAPSLAQNQQQQQHQLHVQQSSPGGQYNFVSTSGPATGLHITAQIPKQPVQPTTEFFVHEYSPPQDMKRSATQRKITADSGPKNYTFANQGPEHFERDKAKKGQDVRFNSPSSSPISASSILL